MNNTWHSVDLYSTLINDDIRPPPPFAIPLDEAQGIEWIQSLTIISVVSITLLSCAALLQIHIHDHCWHDFTKIQLRHSSALLLFILFFIALLSFYLNSIVFIYMVLTLQSFDALTICYRIGYELGKTLMSQFFVLRLHLVFKDSTKTTQVLIFCLFHAHFC